ncbi:MAG: hypothetical protein HY690_20425 [Chloroflexi bacterium]|nr:hypothetical protein [Chloroflexota bacterium]
MPHEWWQPVAWTVAAAASLNVLLGYLLAQTIWPTRVPALGQTWVLALGLVAAACVGLAVRGWTRYLRARQC